MTTEELLGVITICLLITTVLDISRWFYSFVSEK